MASRSVRCGYCLKAFRADPGAGAFPTCRQCRGTTVMCAKCCEENELDVRALELKVDFCPECANGTQCFYPVQ